MRQKTTWTGALLVSLVGAPLLAQIYGLIANIALSGVMRTFASANLGIIVLALLQILSLALLGKQQARRRPAGEYAFWAAFVWYLLCAAAFSAGAPFLPAPPPGALLFFGWCPTAYWGMIMEGFPFEWPLWIPALAQSIVLAGFYYGRWRAR
ncbi:hypothetical protein [Cronobacter dublinensis]|uniref:hypothetical protein n=1 Tax=Cronobacter dublinensis TaxID=413497 RepID=UPI00300E57CD